MTRRRYVRRALVGVILVAAGVAAQVTCGSTVTYRPPGDVTLLTNPGTSSLQALPALPVARP
jgi:hypothetical protein